MFACISKHPCYPRDMRAENREAGGVVTAAMRESAYTIVQVKECGHYSIETENTWAEPAGGTQH